MSHVSRCVIGERGDAVQLDEAIGAAEGSPGGVAGRGTSLGATRWNTRMRAPASLGSSRYSGSAELSRECPFVHPEDARHGGERRALLVLCGGQSDGLVVHLAHHRPSGDVGLVEVVHDGGPVHLVPAGECVDRGAVSVLADQVLDLRPGEPALHRV